jgi:hypothetical protein
MKRILILIALWLPSQALAETINELYLFTFTNHMHPGATTGDDCSLDIGGTTIDAYNEENCYNEENWGLGFGQTRENTLWIAAKYNNSFCGRSNLLLSGIGFRADDTLLGIAVGAVDGYEDHPQAVATYFIKTPRVLILLAETKDDGYTYHLAFSWPFEMP